MNPLDLDITLDHEIQLFEKQGIQSMIVFY